MEDQEFVDIAMVALQEIGLTEEEAIRELEDYRYLI